MSKAADEHQYLRIADLRRLRHLFFSSKRVVEGQYAGRHTSPQRGHSVEFSDYREYRPGDELGDVDWKVYGRSDRYYIKLFEHQSDMTVHLLLDASASMAYKAEGRDSKFQHACRMAASIAFLVIKQQDHFSYGTVRQGLRDFQRPSGTYAQLNAMLEQMQRTEPEGQAKLDEAVKSLSGHISRKGLVIVFSDLLEDDQAVIKSLSLLIHRGLEVIVFHILDADELQLPDMAEAIFVDSESRRQLRLNVDDIRPAYQQRLKRFLQRWSSACRARGIDYKLVSTAQPYHKALEDYMFSRSAMS